jgi:multidrug efflux pump subunit AcrB
LQFFFQPADIVDQVLNFGQPAPIDIRVSGPNKDDAYGLAAKLARDLQRVPGIVDSHVFQVPDAPTLNVNVDRAFAADVGLDQSATAGNVLVTTNGSAQTAPNFWVDPTNGVSYPLAVQLPTYKIESTQDLWTMPITSGGARGSGQLLMNLAAFGRGKTPMVMSQLNIRPVFDVQANVEGRDLGTHLSVLALMGTLMSIGLTTANSILVVTFANQRMLLATTGRRRRLLPDTHVCARS